jgi:hypothetical protein
MNDLVDATGRHPDGDRKLLLSDPETVDEVHLQDLTRVDRAIFFTAVTSSVIAPQPGPSERARLFRARWAPSQMCPEQHTPRPEAVSPTRPVPIRVN